VATKSKTQDPCALLSRRELQVLELAARGLTNSQVAADLGVTIHSVKFHLTSIYRKLGVNNRTGAVVQFMTRSEVPADGGA
jgi:DNA-binding CsgD family transcriptional regulator